MPFIKLERWAELTVFKQYLWNGWTDLKNRLAKKERPHRGTHGRSLISFGSMTSSHEQKRTLFFYLSVRHALFRVLFLHQFGRHWAQNIGFVDTNRMNVFLS